MSEEYQPDNQWKRLLNRNPKCATVSVEIAGAVLGLSRASAYGLAKSGEIPTIRMGRRLLVPKAALEKLLASV
jgi:excisionase family DNA binding protein